jgi:hypothetical protein
MMDPRLYGLNPPPSHYVCHRKGDACDWDGCPNQHDTRACEGCFLIQPPETA